MADNKKRKKQRRDHYTFVVVGVGGTGGELVTTLAKYIYDRQVKDDFFGRLILIDGDRVEEKNCGRQPFVLDDVGMFKVDALSMAISECLPQNGTNKPVEVFSDASYIDDVGEFTEMVFEHAFRCYDGGYLYDNHYHIVICGCVDNHRARQTLDRFFNECKATQKGYDLLYLDSANEFDFGSVVSSFKDRKGVECPARAFYFPEVLTSKEKKASEQSCGVVNVSTPQHYKTNKMAANLVFSLITNFVEERDYFKGWIYFDTRSCEVTRKPLEKFIGELYTKYKCKTYPTLLKKLEKEQEKVAKRKEGVQDDKEI